jgi:hypothetical protein
MCSPTQPDHFICPSTEVFGTAPVIWGLIGPRRIFSPGHTYYLLIFFFLIGAVSPAVTPIPSSNTSTSPLSTLELVSFHPLQLSTTSLGELSVSSSSITSEGASLGGASTITSFLPHSILVWRLEQFLYSSLCNTLRMV